MPCFWMLRQEHDYELLYVTSFIHLTLVLELIMRSFNGGVLVSVKDIKYFYQKIQATSFDKMMWTEIIMEAMTNLLVHSVCLWCEE